MIVLKFKNGIIDTSPFYEAAQTTMDDSKKSGWDISVVVREPAALEVHKGTILNNLEAFFHQPQFIVDKDNVELLGYAIRNPAGSYSFSPNSPYNTQECVDQLSVEYPYVGCNYTYVESTNESEPELLVPVGFYLLTEADAKMYIARRDALKAELSKQPF